MEATIQRFNPAEPLYHLQLALREGMEWLCELKSKLFIGQFNPLPKIMEETDAAFGIGLYEIVLEILDFEESFDHVIPPRLHGIFMVSDHPLVALLFQFQGLHLPLERLISEQGRILKTQIDQRVDLLFDFLLLNL